MLKMVLIGSAGMWPMLYLLVGERDPPRLLPVGPVAARWVDEPPAVLRKGDRLPIQSEAIELMQVTVEPVGIERTEVDQNVRATASVARQSHNHGRKYHDICTRHGMHKVITRGGRSWRCRR
jgi:hypothetical protein